MYYLREGLSFRVEIYEAIGKFIFLKVAKIKTKTRTLDSYPLDPFTDLPNTLYSR